MYLDDRWISDFHEGLVVPGYETSWPKRRCFRDKVVGRRHEQTPVPIEVAGQRHVQTYSDLLRPTRTDWRWWCNHERSFILSSHRTYFSYLNHFWFTFQSSEVFRRETGLLGPNEGSTEIRLQVVDMRRLAQTDRRWWCNTTNIHFNPRVARHWYGP